MAWVFLQVFLAFGVAVFIVWWTFPKSEKNAKPLEPPNISPPEKSPSEQER